MIVTIIKMMVNKYSWGLLVYKARDCYVLDRPSNKPRNQVTKSAIINQRNQLQCAARQLCLLVCKHHEYYSSLQIINRSICTNLAIVSGPRILRVITVGVVGVT